MNKAPWIFGSIALVFAAVYGCGNGGTTTTTAASTGHATSSSSHASSGTTGTGGKTTGTGGSGGAGGSGGGGGFGGSPECDPFTNVPCNTAMGEACDTDGTTFSCFPAPNNVALCGTCGEDPGDGGAADYCSPGKTCLDSSKCAAFCCNDGDCGAGGKCDMTVIGSPTVGVCTDGAVIPDAGGGGAGGAPIVEPGCNAPASPPSNGSCYMP